MVLDGRHVAQLPPGSASSARTSPGRGEFGRENGVSKVGRKMMVTDGYWLELAMGNGC